jgi:hypothetical protein
MGRFFFANLALIFASFAVKKEEGTTKNAKNIRLHTGNNFSSAWHSTYTEFPGNKCVLT